MKPLPQSLHAQIDQLRRRLDRICGEVTFGVRDAAHYNALENEAGLIADGLRGAFRKQAAACDPATPAYRVGELVMLNGAMFRCVDSDPPRSMNAPPLREHRPVLSAREVRA